MKKQIQTIDFSGGRKKKGGLGTIKLSALRLPQNNDGSVDCAGCAKDASGKYTPC